MSVNTYVPASPTDSSNSSVGSSGNATVSMTAAAIARTRTQVAREKALGLRLSVKPSGCSGFMYVLDIVHEEASGDHRFTFGDVTLFVDEKSLPVVNGTEIDYVQEGLNSLFKFQNPNATGECGCGESFTTQ